MLDAIARLPLPQNEPVRSYAPSTPERAELKRALESMPKEVIDIPLVIGGEEIRTGKTLEVRAPHRRELLLARAHQGGASEIEKAIQSAVAAQREWAAMPWTARAAIFLRAAELLATKYRPVLNAATMLGQSKTAYQAEIDSACELIDFLRFNVEFARRLHEEQPRSAPGTWNIMEPRPLEGFVYAVTPFNFTAIAGNLPTAPALMGNTVVWKPSQLALYSAHFVLKLLQEAGLPDGVINLVMGDPAELSRVAIDHPDFAGLHFTGSSAVFRQLWRRIGENIDKYRSFPRIVGETGGKDFIFVHPSADLDAVAVACVRGAFEYQGQKCSAASRLYAPASLWPALKERIVALIGEIRMGDVSDFRNFMGAVIDERAFARISSYLDLARTDSSCTVLAGGKADDTQGFFVAPTFVETTSPEHRLMREEIFGPVLAAWVYPDGDYERALELCETTSPYALTGAFFARDRAAIEKARGVLRNAAGNFYVNDKPTGAVVDQQPFGGGRASGTNDKAGSIFNLVRWISPRVVKETFVPPVSVPYPSMNES